MQRTSFAEMACSLARSLDVVGEPWTPLIVRDIWMGLRRFDEIQANLDVSRKVLAERLKTLVREGVLERELYQREPARYEYVLTQKGIELTTVLLALMAWGDRWVSTGKGPPMLLRHTVCGNRCKPTVMCSACGKPLSAHELRFAPGPGARDGWGTPWEKFAAPKKQRR